MSEYKRENRGELIGRGKTARVYKIDSGSHYLVRKEFSPIHPVKLWNWFFYHSPHPLITDAGHKYAYWKRKVAHRLCECLNSNIRIPDALHLSHRGFTATFVEGHRPSKREKRAFRSLIKRLEDFFTEAGMPTWSFSRKNPFSSSNFLLQNNTIYVIDYEQSVPVRDSKGRISYDTIYFDDVYNFITGNRQRISDRLGEEGIRHLEEAFDMSREYHGKLDVRPKKITKVMNLAKSRRGRKNHG